VLSWRQGASRGPGSSGVWSRAAVPSRSLASKMPPPARVDLILDEGRCQPFLGSAIGRITPFMRAIRAGGGAGKSGFFCRGAIAQRDHLGNKKPAYGGNAGF
jgi:hypothetical protein